jgi:hypothetical protein
VIANRQFDPSTNMVIETAVLQAFAIADPYFYPNAHHAHAMRLQNRARGAGSKPSGSCTLLIGRPAMLAAGVQGVQHALFISLKF